MQCINGARIKGNDGTKLYCTPLTQHCLFFVVRAPLLVSVIDHSKYVFALCDLGHLHHMHEYSALADSMPQMVAKYFQSPPRKKYCQTSICNYR